MSEKQKRFFLKESEIPTQWYNIQADMPNKPLPPIHPATKQPLKAEDLFPIFAEELARQELICTSTIVPHLSCEPMAWRRLLELPHISISRTRA